MKQSHKLMPEAAFAADAVTEFPGAEGYKERAKKLVSGVVGDIRDNGKIKDMADGDRANNLTKAIGNLQEAMDAAIMAGLDVEPNFRVVSNRFCSVGIQSDSFICDVRVYRQLI